jgi:hypothetical protein
MPVTPPATGPLTPILSSAPFANQVQPSGSTPYVQQGNFGQMVGWVLNKNPDQDPESVKVDINMEVRKIYDRRTWYGLMVRGQIATSGFFIGGTCNLTNGTNLVQGNGTSWTYSLIGQQFRQGYNSPPYNVIQVDPANQVLALEMPWAAPSITNSSYFIQKLYYTIGPNIKYVHTCKNLIQAWRLHLGYNQQSLDAIDIWRISTLTPRALVQMPPDPQGNYQVELYPSPAIQQSLPFIAVVQPPNLVYDTDTLPPYIRCDIVAKFSMANALVHRGPKINQYYDLPESQRLRGEAESELLALAMSDENLYRQDLKYKWEEMRMAPSLGAGGAYYNINHGVEASAWDGWDI